MSDASCLLTEECVKQSWPVVELTELVRNMLKDVVQLLPPWGSTRRQLSLKSWPNRVSNRSRRVSVEARCLFRYVMAAICSRSV